MLKRSCNLLLALLWLGSAPGSAFESQWTAGLNVVQEQLSDQIGVNGMLFRVQRATGRDVPMLAQRIHSDWLRESGPGAVQSLHQSDWTLFSRILQGESQVVQWRGAGERAELLWSATDLQHADTSMPVSAVPVPADCLLMRPVHGWVEDRPFLQVSGACQHDPRIVLADLRRALLGRGWKLQQAGTGFVRAQRETSEAQIIVAPTPGLHLAHRDLSTSIVILERVAGRRSGP